VSARLLRAEGLTKVFGAGRTAVLAVDGVDLSVASGELVLVMGPSGSGKTTLLSMIGGLLRPSRGRVSVGGVELTGLSRRELTRVRRESIGFVFQTFNLLESLNALENVEIALNIAGVKGREAERRARLLLLDTGLEARLGFRVGELSGGERQRVAIARSLANEPRLLLADEPTANLDSKHGREVMHLLRELACRGDRAAVVVSHDPRVEEAVDRVLWLEDGRLTGAPPAETDEESRPARAGAVAP
jgi:putative ABC transport system ATP-binding protein